MQNEIKVDMTIEVPASVSADEVYARFILWVEANGWCCNGIIGPGAKPTGLPVVFPTTLVP